MAHLMRDIVDDKQRRDCPQNQRAPWVPAAQGYLPRWRSSTMSPHRLRRAALHLPLRRSERGLLYFHHGLLGGAAVAAVRAGTDLTCGTEYRTLVDEVRAGRIGEAEINRSLERLFVARFRLGMFDPPERVPYSKIPISENDSIAHRQVAREAEREAIVLLKNEDRILPLSRSVRKIAVIGPSADDPIALLGNYNGISSRQVTPLEGIERQFASAQVRYALGATYTANTQALIPSTFLKPPEGWVAPLQILRI